MSQKVAIITGAARGIGAACAKKLSEENYRVVLHYRSSHAEVKKLSETIENSYPIQADLSDERACLELIDKVKKDLGQIDVLVNNAGMKKDQILAFAKPADFDELMSTNLKPVFLLSKYTAKAMLRKRSGSIVNITSVVGHLGNAGQSIYTATKGAVTALTKSMAQELAAAGIRCNCVAPGFIETAMTESLPQEVKDSILAKIPQKKFGSPKDIAEAVAFLCSDAASYITGTSLHVNGGMYMG